IMSLDEGDTLAAVGRVPSEGTSQIGDEPTGEKRPAPSSSVPSGLEEDLEVPESGEDGEENSCWHHRGEPSTYRVVVASERLGVSLRARQPIGQGAATGPRVGRKERPDSDGSLEGGVNFPI
ncbi:MAG: hypothetical protein ACK5AM_01465, partial [Pirellulaceae bacterium]